MRIVSLIASATEIVHALGAGSGQVARSHECDWPPGVLNLPELTRPKFKVHGQTSRAIDTSVKSLVEQGLAVYEVDAEALKSVGPDIILTQDQCEVCAVSLADVERAIASWTDCRASVISLRPHTMSDVLGDIARIGASIGRPEAAGELVASMKSRLDSIQSAVRSEPPPRLAFIEWIEPPMSGGHWMPELIELAGGVNLLGETGSQSPWIKWMDVATAAPEIILVAPCGYDIATTEREMRSLAENPVWCSLEAVKQGKVYIADGNAYFNRPGPRLCESAEILAEILHPGICRFGHEGLGYIRWTG